MLDSIVVVHFDSELCGFLREEVDSERFLFSSFNIVLGLTFLNNFFCENFE